MNTTEALAVLQRLIQEAKEFGVFAEVAAAALDKPCGPNGEAAFLTEAEEEALEAALDAVFQAARDASASQPS